VIDILLIKIRDPEWVLSVILAGFIISLLSNFSKDWIYYLFGNISTKMREKGKARDQKHAKQVASAL